MKMRHEKRTELMSRRTRRAEKAFARSVKIPPLLKTGRGLLERIPHDASHGERKKQRIRMLIIKQ